MDKDPLQETGSSQPRAVGQPKKAQRQISSTDMADTLAYTHTIMYGRYATDLSEYAKDEARKLKVMQRRRKAEDRRRERERVANRDGRLRRSCFWLWHNTLGRFGTEWIFLALLGISMAMISFFVDIGVHVCTSARIWLYRDIFNSSLLMQYWAWVFPAICLVLFAAGFTHLVAPQAVGSGIPEMKTIMRGVVLKEYLTFKTLVAKAIGLVATLGSGMPIGKEGPFVHIASIVARQLSKLRFHGIYENKSRYNDMLAAACAVGIGACFAAPIGGVLFSIEATTTFFAVRNCGRGFFAAVCGSAVFLLMEVWFKDANTIRALFMTNFTAEFPFAPQEILVFALMGLICGFLGAGYVWLHRWYVMFIRSNKRINNFLQKNRFMYPAIIALIVSSVSFPLGGGQYMGAELSTHEQLTDLFSNFTWTRGNLTVAEAAVTSRWKTPDTSVFLNLVCYTLFNYIFSVICYTLPVPSGSFIPVFKFGASFGRIFGELVHSVFPQGVWYGRVLSSIIPGGYAVAGAAALSSAVTHTVTEAVIIFEITGQVTHVVPVMVASLIANAVAEMLQPSMYDSMIMIKKLPYLPNLLPSNSRMYKTVVDDFMRRDVKYLWTGITYQKLQEMLQENRSIRNLPLVDNPETMILLGSVQRSALEAMIERQISREKRLAVSQQWRKAAEQRALDEQQLELERQQQQVVRRRSSRFEVLPAPNILSPDQNSNDENALAEARKRQELINNSFYGQSPKSILKKTNSFGSGQTSGSDNRPRSVLDDILKRSANLRDVETGSSQDTSSLSGSRKTVQLAREYVVDMSPEDQQVWEYEEMSKVIDLNRHHVPIDPSPFQLVERTSIIKVHNLFNMVGINHAYVTQIGRLVGVVGLAELRKAIEDINSKGFVLPPLPKDDEAKPLIGNDKSDKNVNTTITSMDSAFSMGPSEVSCDMDSADPNKPAQPL